MAEITHEWAAFIECRGLGWARKAGVGATRLYGRNRAKQVDNKVYKGCFCIRQDL